MDRKFTENEQYAAEMAQAFSFVMNGQSHNHLDQARTLDFIGALRKYYVPLTRRSAPARILELEKNVRQQVIGY